MVDLRKGSGPDVPKWTPFAFVGVVASGIVVYFALRAVGAPDQVANALTLVCMGGAVLLIWGRYLNRDDTPKDPPVTDV